MIMCDRYNQSHFLNIYKKSSIENVLFTSDEFNNSISEYNKNLCNNYKILVDYKNNKINNLFDTFLSNKLTDQFHSLFIDDEEYFIVFKPSVE